MKLYNTLTKLKEEFVPLKADLVKMYACGVTVYDYCHLGHARALITYDLLCRYLKFLGFKVVFVRNFTDIDDKIIDRAREQGIECGELTKKFITAFHQDASALNLIEPSHEPRATAHITEIIKLIEVLIKKGLAYTSGVDVFYHVRAFPSYGQLAQKNIDELSSGARVDVMESKRDPLDFTLWKGEKPGEPSWPSPWGRGRPGWHIECSAMSMNILGESLDIHCGGRDLIFPHHENEIAQSEGVTKKNFVRYWVHNGFVNINAEKMSKSIGNFFTIRDVLKKFPAEVVRLFILSAHYRSPIDYNDKTIHNAALSLNRFYETKGRIQDFVKDAEKPKEILKEFEYYLLKYNDIFKKSLDDDLNTAKVVGTVFELVRLANKALDEGKIDKKLASTFLDVMAKTHAVLGLFGTDANVYLAELKRLGLASTSISEEEIRMAILKRREARAKKDFAEADNIRLGLLQNGIDLKDNPDGTTTWMIN